MSDVENSHRLRLDRCSSSSQATPLDVLRAAAHDLEAGKVKCDCVLVVFMDRPKDGAWQHETYRSNLTADQELVALELSKQKCLSRWLGD